MAVKVRIPTPLRSLTEGQAEVAADGKTVQEMIENLENRYAGIRERICDESGQLRRFVNLYLNDEDIRFMSDLDTELHDGDTLSIVPAIAGG
jgi:molybdopterin synthase sulfur carrier subunit